MPDLRKGVCIATKGDVEAKVWFSGARTKSGRKCGGVLYAEGAVSPSLPWVDKLALEPVVTPGDPACGIVGLLEIPRDLFALHRDRPSELVEARVARLRGERRALTAFEAEINNWALEMSSGTQLGACLGLNGQEGGLETVTTDPATGLRTGLHVDSWFGEGSDVRLSRPGRLCINLGPGLRYFLFVPPSGMFSTGLLGNEVEANVFDAVHLPDVVVYGLEVPAGCGYIAATEALIHDGSTYGSGPSLTYTYLGEFGTVWDSDWKFATIRSPRGFG